MNRRLIILSGASIITGNNLLIELVIQHIVEGAPVFGGTPTWVDVGDESGLQMANDVTTVTGGHSLVNRVVAGALGAGSAAGTQSVRGLIEPSSYLARNSDNSDTDYLHLVATNLTGTSASLFAAMNFQERF